MVMGDGRLGASCDLGVGITVVQQRHSCCLSCLMRVGVSRAIFGGFSTSTM